ncbi:hypothetical protein ACQEV9_44845 [Streptomyces chartreusis]|uniref:hypothetical protein n=1 Tax=Streptomyces chartreusis TaxID=1969 RepID=UPI003D909620
MTQPILRLVHTRPVAELDLVALLRLASVYRAFDSLEDFEAAIAAAVLEAVIAEFRKEK